MTVLHNERLFERQMTRIGLCMLLQEVLFFAPEIFCGWFLYPFLESVLSEVGAYVAESLIDGASYMLAFMLPALVLRKSVVPTEPVPYRPVVKRDVFLYVPAALAIVLSCSVINSLMLPSFYSTFSEEYLWASSASANYQVVLSFITTALIPGVCEEFLFRGAVQTSLRPFGRTISVVGSALLFGLMHGNAGQFFYTFCAGIVFGLLREKFDSLWPGMLVHVFNNAFSVFSSALYERVNSAAADMVIFAADGILFALGFVCMLMLFRRALAEKEEKNAAPEMGNFGVVLPSSPLYVPYPLENGRALRLSINVPMVFFLLCAVGRSVLFLVMAAFGLY